jgi:hypothetical protein
MSTLLLIIASIIVLLLVTYWNTIRDTEHFESKTVPEFEWNTLNETDTSCKAAMDKCKDPFCMDFDTGTGPLMDCTKEYVKYFSETNGLIPTYQSGDWSGFSF